MFFSTHFDIFSAFSTSFIIELQALFFTENLQLVLECFLAGWSAYDVYFSALEAHGAVSGGKKGEVLAHSDVKAGQELGSALPDNN